MPWPFSAYASLVCLGIEDGEVDDAQGEELLQSGVVHPEAEVGVREVGDDVLEAEPPGVFTAAVTAAATVTAATAAAVTVDVTVAAVTVADVSVTGVTVSVDVGGFGIGSRGSRISSAGQKLGELEQLLEKNIAELGRPRACHAQEYNTFKTCFVCSFRSRNRLNNRARL